ncbi:hypothetical protein ACFFRR_001242 [Megaselia abdita]
MEFFKIVSILVILNVAFGAEDEWRIIGGDFASQGQFPYQVSLQLNSRHHCGGAVISEGAVVTAAHCTIGQNPTSMKVIAGTNDLLANHIEVGVARLLNHPQYNPKTNDYDLALVILNQPLPLGPKIKAIDLADSSNNYPADTMAIVSGWGAINSNLQLPSKLKYAKVQLWSREFCNPNNIPGITDRMICAGHPSGQISSCQGDSGGPLTVDNKLFGVVSWGFGCGIAGKPAMYTYIGNLSTWIKQTASL